MVECLLIESNSAERKRLAALLTGLGIHCEEREMAAEGVRYALEKLPEVVMMEASALPTTREFLRLVGYQRTQKSKPIVILYSDTHDVEAVVQSIYEGAAEFLARPFDRDLLKFKLVQAGVLNH